MLMFNLRIQLLQKSTKIRRLRCKQELVMQNDFFL